MIRSKPSTEAFTNSGVRLNGDSTKPDQRCQRLDGGIDRGNPCVAMAAPRPQKDKAQQRDVVVPGDSACRILHNAERGVMMDSPVGRR